MSDIMKEEYPNLEEWLNEGLEFSSSEHLWQALKATDEKTFLKFIVGGEYDAMNAKLFERMDKKVNGNNKVTYWSKKNNVGIIPKMVSTHSKELGLKNYKVKDLYLSEKNQEIIWLDILRQKYVQNQVLKTLLLSTDNKYLLEFDKGAKRSNSYWGGYIDDENNLYGKNTMGNYLMLLRQELRPKKKIILLKKK